MQKKFFIIFPFSLLHIAVFIILAAIFSALLFFPVSALEYPDLKNCSAALIYNIDNQKLLFSSGGDAVIAPASTVKLMTAVIALDFYSGEERLDKEITITSEMLKDVTGNNIGLRAGEIVTAKQLLSALIAGGSNDAAYALAYDSYGSAENFVRAMNDKADEMGMSGTYYTNPTGIDSAAMRTTLNDTLSIALEAYRRNTYMELAGTARYVMEPTNKSEKRYIHNRNYMIATNVTSEYFDKTVTGMSSGMTEEGGWCLAATSRRDGITQLIIVMGGGREKNDDGTFGPIYSYVNAKLLFDWAFTGFDYIRVLEGTKMICEIPVTLGRGVDHVTLLPEQSLDLYLPADINVESDIMLTWALDKPSLIAPVKAGESAGLLTLYYQDEIIGRVNLVVKNNVELYKTLQILYGLRSAVISKTFRLAAAAAGGIGVIYIIIVAVVRGRKNRKNSYKR